VPWQSISLRLCGLSTKTRLKCHGLGTACSTFEPMATLNLMRLYPGSAVGGGNKELVSTRWSPVNGEAARVGSRWLSRCSSTTFNESFDPH
jgi:hypothetical protein